MFPLNGAPLGRRLTRRRLGDLERAAIEIEHADRAERHRLVAIAVADRRTDRGRLPAARKRSSTVAIAASSGSRSPLGGLWILAPREVADHHRGGLRELAGQHQLRQVAIDLVRPLADLLEQRDRTVERQRPRRTDQQGRQRQVRRRQRTTIACPWPVRA